MVQVAGAAVGTSVDASEKQAAWRAVVWMIGAVAGYALLPLLVWAGIRDMPPFFFVAIVVIANTALGFFIARESSGQSRRLEGNHRDKLLGVNR